jgi:Mn-dependent DtxR family transcriptional regulator
MYLISYVCYSYPVPDKQWTFLSNYGHVLVYLSRHPESRVRDIATAIGITERSALGIISQLEDEGYILVEKIGRRNKYRVNGKLKFRHSMESHKSISSLIKIFS